ncbi:4Fe-4S ferredoxin iron-sulfur binding domain protein [Ruminiclostridium papyrosolvens DSM 2782]|uniref:Ferredoxin n=1 Tax=Ruminiclostridium papyrosolvens DSM 2782 TaxID=588581 RepID=F1THJ0_9FIRM|nr:ferredoxin [Ruminiclostridium papyrosolvens]EGD46193.1 4Fe-4S ferredoxin iron-sulfur binding domain protein [Ruminiclostridium papyrosolvens DSM 2782]WES35973.1 ferredoxin [Ruminiclostridium papyrosolvens DSM 2782]
MKASVDQDGCISCELCTSICPAVFSMNEDNKAEAIEEDIQEENLQEAEDARDACPVSVIDLEE